MSNPIEKARWQLVLAVAVVAGGMVTVATVRGARADEGDRSGGGAIQFGTGTYTCQSYTGPAFANVQFQFDFSGSASQGRGSGFQLNNSYTTTNDCVQAAAGAIKVARNGGCTTGNINQAYGPGSQMFDVICSGSGNAVAGTLAAIGRQVLGYAH